MSISRSPILHRKVNIHTDNTGTDHFILYMHREYNNSSPTRVIPFKDDSISFQIGHYTVTQVWITEWRREGGERERKSYLIYEFHRGERERERGGEERKNKIAQSGRGIFQDRKICPNRNVLFDARSMLTSGS